MWAGFKGWLITRLERETNFTIWYLYLYQKYHQKLHNTVVFSRNNSLHLLWFPGGIIVICAHVIHSFIQETFTAAQLIYIILWPDHSKYIKTYILKSPNIQKNTNAWHAIITLPNKNNNNKYQHRALITSNPSAWGKSQFLKAFQKSRMWCSMIKDSQMFTYLRSNKK